LSVSLVALHCRFFVLKVQLSGRNSSPKAVGLASAGVVEWNNTRHVGVLLLLKVV